MESENGKTRRSRRRFCAEEKARVVGQYKESGLTQVEFCRREGVSLFNLQRCWESRIDPEKRFVEVEPRALGEHGRYRLGFEEGGWLESREDSMSRKLACWPAL